MKKINFLLYSIIIFIVETLFGSQFIGVESAIFSLIITVVKYLLKLITRGSYVEYV